MNKIKRTCKECLKNKPITDFSKHEGGLDGYLQTCDNCRYQKVKDEINSILQEGITPVKKCAKCGIDKCYLDFNNSPKGKFGKTSYCKLCEKGISKLYISKYKLENDKTTRDFLECSSCFEILSIDNFHKNSSGCGGYILKCKDCLSSKIKIEIKEKVCQECKLTIKIENFHNDKYSKDGKTRNCKDCRRKYKKEYVKNNKDKINKTRRARRAEPKNKKRDNLSCRFRALLKIKDIDKILSFSSVIDVSKEELENYIQGLFEPGMTLKNNTPLGWHIDHIIPCEAYDLEDIEEQKKCFHHLNLRPCWATTEIAKRHGSSQIGNNNKSDFIIPELLTNFHLTHLYPKGGLIGMKIWNGGIIENDNQIKNLVCKPSLTVAFSSNCATLSKSAI